MAVRSFDTLKPEYAALWASSQVKEKYRSEVMSAARKIMAGRARYERIAQRTGVPWYVTGIMHAMECGCDFNRHLHNGDSLERRTRQVPAGRPLTGEAPFSFEDSAVDALTMPGKCFDKITDWSIERIAYTLETMNGWGYRGKGVNSAYLWSYTNQYSGGKYVADHVWSATAISGQPGGMAILKALIEIDPTAVEQKPAPVDAIAGAWPKAEEPAPVYMAVAATSTSVRLKLVSMLTVVLGWLESVFGWIPEIKTEADSILSPLMDLSKAAKVNIAGITVIVVVLCGVIVIARHTKDKSELKTLKGE